MSHMRAEGGKLVSHRCKFDKALARNAEQKAQLQGGKWKGEMRGGGRRDTRPYRRRICPLIWPFHSSTRNPPRCKIARHMYAHFAKLALPPPRVRPFTRSNVLSRDSSVASAPHRRNSRMTRSWRRGARSKVAQMSARVTR